MTLQQDYYRGLAACSTNMPPGLDTWIREHSLVDVFAPQLYTTVVWIKNCMFASASGIEQSLACMDLGLWFYYLDDYEGDDYADVFDSCLAVLDDRPVPPLASFPALAYAELMQRVRALPGYGEAYCQTRRNLVTAYQWRNPVNRAGADVSYEQYYQCRLHTIYIRQWVALMSAIRGCSVERCSDPAAMEGLLRVLIHWHILINELASIRKDLKNGETNLVVLRAKEESITIAEATSVTMAELEKTVAEYRARYTEIARKSDQVDTAQLLEIIDRSIVGALETYHENSRRYQASFVDAGIALPSSIW